MDHLVFRGYVIYPILYIKFQALDLEKAILKAFLQYVGLAAILVCDQNRFDKFSFPLILGCSILNLTPTDQAAFR